MDLQDLGFGEALVVTHEINGLIKEGKDKHLKVNQTCFEQASNRIELSISNY
jgi:hypothetical protein